MQTKLKPTIPHLTVVHPGLSVFLCPLDYEPLQRPSQSVVLVLALTISLTLHLAMLSRNWASFFQMRPTTSPIEVDLTGPYEMVPPDIAALARPVRKGTSNGDSGKNKEVKKEENAGPAKSSSLPVSPSPAATDGRPGILTGPEEGAEYALISLTSLPKLKNKDALSDILRRFYPESERQAGHEGKVTLDLHLDAAGRVTKTDLVQSGGPAFDQAALQVAALLEFEPARSASGAVPVKIRQTIYFQLNH